MSREHDVPTTDQLRKEIDRGQTGDKAPGTDPAAAPLGTDDEASGHPPTREQRAMEAEALRRAAPKRPSAGGDATESLRAADSEEADEARLGRRRDAARPSEGESLAESARAAESIPGRDGSDARLDDATGDRNRRSAAP